MASVMTAKELADKCRRLAQDYKTLYILGCFGAPMTAKNRKRYSTNRSFNAQADRAAKINSAGEDTFGFDCVCMIKGLLWGWCGDSGKVYGGAKYKSNDVPDVGADSLFRKCTDASTDFSSLEVGEAVWLSGHIGIYIGDGLAVECTNKWADGVQITACNCEKAGYKTRNWTKHGKLPYVSYESYSLARLRQEVALVVENGAVPTLSTTENRVHILVCLAQKRLKILGFDAGEADGVFGSRTEAAVKAYQCRHHLDETGKLDTATWSFLLERENGSE